MNAQTRLSAKGQIVIPKDVRDRLGWEQGSTLEVVPSGDGVLLRRSRRAGKRSVEDVTRDLHRIIDYRGATIPTDELSWSADVDARYRKDKP